MDNNYQNNGYQQPDNQPQYQQPPVNQPGAYPEYGQPQYQQPPVNVDPGTAPPVLSIISMVCGIMAIVFCWCPIFGIIMGAAAIVLAILAKKKNARKAGMATAGIITGAIGAAICLIVTIIFFVGVAEVNRRQKAYNDIYNYVYDYDDWEW